MNKAFTLIEVLIYVGITAIIGGFLIGIFLIISQIHQRESAATEVGSQLNFINQRIGQLIRESSNIEIETSVSTSTLKLRMKDPAKDPTCISLVNGVIKLAEGPGANPNKCSTNLSDLTNNRVIVDSLNFKKFTTYPGHDTVSIDIQMTYNSNNPKSRITRNLTSAIARVSAATFDSSILPGSTSFEIGQQSSPWSRVYLSDGTALNPSYTFGNDTSLGIFKVTGTSAIGFSTQGFERMRIDASGNIGIGTTNPQELIHAVSNSDADFNLQTSATNQQSGFHTLRSRGTASAPAIVQTGDYIGTYLGMAYSGSSFVTMGGMQVRMDPYSSISSSNMPSILEFATHSGSESNLYTVKMVINSNGDIGIGTTNPTQKLEVYSGHVSITRPQGDTTSAILMLNQNNASTRGNYWFAARNDGSFGVYDADSGVDRIKIVSDGNLSLQPASGNVGIGTTTPSTKLTVAGLTPSQAGRTICSDANGNFYYSTGACSVSSEKYKENINNSNLGLETLLQLRPVTFEYKKDYGAYDGTTHLGFIAEEVEKITPLLIDYKDDGLPSGVRYDELTAVLTKAIQEQQQQIEELKKINKNLQLEIEILKEKVK